MATAASLTVDVVANTAKAEDNLDKLGKKVKNTKRDMQGGLKLGEGIDALAKGVLTLEAIKGGIRGVQLIAAAWKGDQDAVKEAMFALPMGIGEINRGLYETLELISGVAEETKRANEEAAKQDKDNAFKKSASDKARGMVEASKKELDGLKREWEKFFKSKPMQIKVDLKYDIEEARQKLDKQLDELGKSGKGSDSPEAKKLLDDFNASVKIRKGLALGNIIAEEADRFKTWAESVMDATKAWNDHIKDKQQQGVNDSKERKREQKEAAKEVLDKIEKEQDRIRANAKRFNPLFDLGVAKRELDELFAAGIIDQKMYKEGLQQAVAKVPGGQGPGLAGYTPGKSIAALQVEAEASRVDPAEQKQLLEKANTFLTQFETKQQKAITDGAKAGIKEGFQDPEVQKLITEAIEKARNL